MSAYVIEAQSHAELFRDLAERREINGTVFELHAMGEVGSLRRAAGARYHAQLSNLQNGAHAENQYYYENKLDFLLPIIIASRARWRRRGRC